MTKNSRKRSGPSRPYVFAVTAMAVMLGLLAWRHPRGSETVVEAQLKFSRHEHPSGDPVLESDPIETVLHDLKSGAAMVAAVQALDPTWLAENYPPSAGDEDVPMADRLAKRLFFRIKPAASDGHFDVAVRFMGGSDAFALRLVEEVTGQFEQMHNNAASADKAAHAVTVAEKELTRLAARIDELQLQRDDYIEAEVAAARDRHEAQLQAQRTLAFPKPEPETINPVSSEQAESEVADTPTTPALPIVEELNPEWTRLNERVQDLESELVDLRQRITPAHPDFLRVKSEKESVAAQLRDTPQFITSQTVAIYSQVEPSGSTTETTVAMSPVPEPEPEADPQAEPVEPAVPVFDEPEVRQEVATSAIGQRLQQQIATAKAEHLKQQQRITQLQADQPSYRETTLLVGQPQVIRRYSEPLSTTQLWITMGISIFVGAVVCSLRSKPQLPETLYSIGDVEKSLQVRSMGGITTKDGPSVAAPTPSQLTWFAKGLVHGSEAVLGAAILMVGLVAISVPGFGGQFLENPFSAFAFAFDRISSFLV
ncbi:MAG: hypothetical protein AAGF97_03820 [Planctomycetota bacterium]